MDSKIVKDARLADLVLKTVQVVAPVSDIPGAEISSGNVELELAKFGADAEVVLAEGFLAASSDVIEKASVSVSGTVATLNFTSAAVATDVIRVVVKMKI